MCVHGLIECVWKGSNVWLCAHLVFFIIISSSRSSSSRSGSSGSINNCLFALMKQGPHVHGSLHVPSSFVLAGERLMFNSMNGSPTNV